MKPTPFRCDQNGQTVVEYLLLLVVMASIITANLMYIKNRYLGDLNKCSNSAYSRTLLCRINSLIVPNGTDKRFQYYPMKK